MSGKQRGPRQPARLSDRVVHGAGEFESVAFAALRDKRRKQRDISKAARKKNRK